MVSRTSKQGIFCAISCNIHSRFGHEHIWNIVKLKMNENGNLQAPCGSGACRTSSSVEGFINMDDTQVLTRPIGSNVAKKAAKGKSVKSTLSSSSRHDKILQQR